jgi:DNA repair photolyase
MKPIYEPKGAAKEYGDLAINIYTGCPHRCTYCYSPQILHMDKEQFHSHVEPRKDIVNEVRKQIEREQITGKLIHLCFTCDPYPIGYDTTPTREIIKILKESGNHVQILTKSAETRDFDLLDSNDWYGVTFSCGDVMANAFEPNAEKPSDRLSALVAAKERGVKTWVSCEPTLNCDSVHWLIITGDYIDKFKIGKLNYSRINIDWHMFGIESEVLCKRYKRNYYIKDGLRKEMEAKHV